jgi:hypothetical protein
MMNDYNQTMGMGPGQGPSSMARLASILKTVGQQYGTADTLRNVITTQRGRIEDMAKDVSNQYTSTKGALMEKYNMLSPLYNSQLGLEEAKRQREFEASQRAKDRARMGGGGGGGVTIVAPPTQNNTGGAPKIDPNALYGQYWKKLQASRSIEERTTIARKMLGLLGQTNIAKTNKVSDWEKKLYSIIRNQGTKVSGPANPYATYY